MADASSPARSDQSGSLSPVWVLVGAIAGSAVGLFFGDYAKLLEPIGRIYVMLLEVAVYPYLVCSLLHGLGSMAPSAAARLFRAGWRFYLLLWLITFGTIGLLLLGIPASQPLQLVPEAAKAGGPGFLDLIIPADFVTALSANYVPAVVVFCITYGIALQRVKNKDALLGILDSMRQASLAFWNAVVMLAPVAVFALFADTVGTTRVREFEAIGLYLLLFFVGTLVLALAVLPFCLQALIGIKGPEIVSELRSAFTIAIVTTLSVSALPFITAATMRLTERLGIDEADRADVIRTNISVAYPLGQLGNFFVYLFIVFAAYVFGHVIPAIDTAALPFVSLLSCVGSPSSSVEAVKFLASWIGLPAQTTDLYVELMALTRYGQVTVSVMGFAFLSFTVTLAYYGKLHLRLARLAPVLALSAAIFAGVALGSKALWARFSGPEQNPYLHFTLDPQLTRGLAVSFPGAAEDPAPQGPDDARLALEHVQRTGVLRVGYNESVIPFSYRNAHGELVGYDISFAYQLARDMNVALHFVSFEWPTLEQDLHTGRFDIAMAGIYVTETRLLNFDASTPYFQSSLALFAPRERAAGLRTRDAILAKKGIRIGVFDDPVLLPRLHRTFPGAEVVIVPPYTQLPDFNTIDAALWSLEQASAVAAVHPDIVAVEPDNAGNPFLFAYLMPPGSEELRRYVDYWLELKRSDGFASAQRAYWIDRLPRADPAPRWSILRNVLGFGVK